MSDYGVEVYLDIVNSELDALGGQQIDKRTGRHTLDGVDPTRVMLRCSIAAGCINERLGLPDYKLSESAGFIRSFNTLEEMQAAAKHADYEGTPDE